MTSLPIERVPGNPSCSPLAVIAIGGVIATVSMTAAAPSETAMAIRVSVSTGR